jgi:glutaminyl-tRNA synthetase
MVLHQKNDQEGATVMTKPDATAPPNFIRNIIEEDLKANKNDGRVHTRFPPEPNGIAGRP